VKNMKYIFLNLKRFDVLRSMGGVNSISPIEEWGSYIAKILGQGVSRFSDATFVVFFPEAHLLSAKSALTEKSPIALGCQGVHFENVSAGGNFGAFTTSFPAAAAASLGCTWTIIGHCEERRKLKSIGGTNEAEILGKSVKCAVESGLNVLYCVGESAEEQPIKEQVLREQLQPVIDFGKTANIVVGYEPVWAIGPGKVPPDEEYIRSIASYIKSIVPNAIVYGGGLKTENAPMLAGIESIDGGLIALTRFSGDIGFYPDEYLEIVSQYLGGKQ